MKKPFRQGLTVRIRYVIIYNCINIGKMRFYAVRKTVSDSPGAPVRKGRRAEESGKTEAQDVPVKRA